MKKRSIDIKYTVIVPTKNNIHFTERMLLSLLSDLKQENIPVESVEIIYLDSSSIDGLQEMVEHYPGIKQRIINFDDDNFSKKNNKGALEAKGRYIILLNNDTEILNDLIRPMEKAFIDDTIGVVSNKHYFPDMKLNHVGIAYRDDRTPVHLYPHEDDKRYPFLNLSRKVPAVTAACVMLKRKDFLKVGGFDEKYEYGYEDVDLCIKYKKELNKDSFVAVDSKIIHFGQSSWGRERGEDKNRRYFLDKWKDQDLVSFKEIYEQDNFERMKKKEALRLKVVSKIKKGNIPTPLLKSTIDPNELKSNTVVFFFDDVFNSFNVVIKNLYESFSRNFGDQYEVLKDSTENFVKYHNSEAVTITWTHFWESYFVKSRKYHERDYRLYAVNYEYEGDVSQVDYWSRHIKNSSFQILSISNYCSDFLRKIGVIEGRINLLNLGYWPEFDQHEPNPKTHTTPKYLIITNSNDPERYATDVAIGSFGDAFSKKRVNVSLLLRDYGSNPTYLKELVDDHLDDLDIEISTGFLSNNELAEMYLSCDVLLNPIRGEGFGMKILEAGALGLVSIAPEYGGPIDFLPQMENITVKYEMRSIGNTIDRKLLLLNDNYYDCEVDRRDLTEVIEKSYENLAELKLKAHGKVSNIRENFSWESISKSLTNIISRIDKDNKVILYPRNKYEPEVKKIYNDNGKADVSIVINSFERPEMIERLLPILESLPDAKAHKCEVVIVNDGSIKPYLPVIEQHVKNSSFSIKYLSYKQNRGNTYSRNLGIINAEGKIAILIGDDILPLPGFISRRISLHDQDSNSLILGHTEWHPSIRNNFIAEFTTKYSNFQFGYEFFRNSREIQNYNLYTSNISFNREELVKKELLLDEINKIVLLEDALWGSKLADNGYKLVYERKIEALHDHPVDYLWFVKRSETIGKTMGDLFLVYPESVNFTTVRSFINILREYTFLAGGQTDEFTDQVKNSIEFKESNLESNVSKFAGLYKNVKDQDNRDLYRALLHKQLHRSNEHFLMKGFLRSMNLDEDYAELLIDEINPLISASQKSNGRPAIRALIKEKLLTSIRSNLDKLTYR